MQMLDDDWLVSHEYQISLAHGSRNEVRYFFGLLLSCVRWSLDSVRCFVDMLGMGYR
jgi:hypothetical protein